MCRLEPEEAFAVADEWLYPQISKHKEQEILEFMGRLPGMALSLLTWSAGDGLVDQFWATAPTVP